MLFGLTGASDEGDLALQRSRGETQGAGDSIVLAGAAGGRDGSSSRHFGIEKWGKLS